MAATIGTAGSKVIRVALIDYARERANKVFVVDGAMSDADIATMLDDYFFVSNAACVSASISTLTPVTGLRAVALNTMERNLSNTLVLGFDKVSPINPAKTVEKSFTIPAYNSAAQGTDNEILFTKPTPGTIGANVPDHLARLIDTLAANLQYEAADGDFYPGDWDFSTPASGFGTVPNVIDGE